MRPVLLCASGRCGIECAGRAGRARGDSPKHTLVGIATWRSRSHLTRTSSRSPCEQADPTTAINCIDQLCRIMIVWTSRAEPASRRYAPPYILRVVIPWIGFDGLLDTAFEQIRHYGKTDIAVSLRLLRAFDDMVLAGVSRKETSVIDRPGATCGRRMRSEFVERGGFTAEAPVGQIGRPVAGASFMIPLLFRPGFDMEFIGAWL